MLKLGGVLGHLRSTRSIRRGSRDLQSPSGICTTVWSPSGYGAPRVMNCWLLEYLRAQLSWPEGLWPQMSLRSLKHQSPDIRSGFAGMRDLIQERHTAIKLRMVFLCLIEWRRGSPFGTHVWPKASPKNPKPLAKHFRAQTEARVRLDTWKITAVVAWCQMVCEVRTPGLVSVASRLNRMHAMQRHYSLDVRTCLNRGNWASSDNKKQQGSWFPSLQVLNLLSAQESGCSMGAQELAVRNHDVDMRSLNQKGALLGSWQRKHQWSKSIRIRTMAKKQGTSSKLGSH